MLDLNLTLLFSLKHNMDEFVTKLRDVASINCSLGVDVQGVAPGFDLLHVDSSLFWIFVE